MRGADQGATNTDRLTVQQAAERLGITEDAVRSRIKRGTLASTHEGGRVYVLVGWSGVDLGAPDQPTDHGDQSAARIEDLREQVAYLRDQLRREQDAHAEARRLLAGALERIPALEAAESAVPSQTPTEASDEPTEATEGRDQPRSFWR